MASITFRAVTRVFSGIQPTGRKHLGNLLGAIRHYVADQEELEGEAIFCVVDLHSMTVPYEPEALRANTRDTACLLMAAGLDPDRCILFVQSHLPEHSELNWILGCVATMGELNRMTQFKSKAAGRESVSLGLYAYPVLQAADVLLYKATRVPVGEDQRQHLELMRDIAGRFNARFGETFPLPEASIPRTAARIADLQDPTRKMSTTDGTEEGTIYVLDPPDRLVRKIRRAVTDSGGEIVAREDKPGVSNLLEILAAVEDRPVPEVEAGFASQGYGALKDAAAEAVVEYLRPIRERYDELAADPAAIEAGLVRGAERARAIAQPVLDEVRERSGLLIAG
ncbi:MAG TPA: tryptophan--tRNA ligase [Miltoncostaeaceae bacterium]|nr:tryptophan--tRNA ligase [Miltoncostaeaceae bacterium]